MSPCERERLPAPSLPRAPFDVGARETYPGYPRALIRRADVPRQVGDVSASSVQATPILPRPRFRAIIRHERALPCPATPSSHTR